MGRITEVKDTTLSSKRTLYLRDKLHSSRKMIVFPIPKLVYRNDFWRSYKLSLQYTSRRI